MKAIGGLFFAALLLLGGCGKKSIACSDEQGIPVVSKIILDAAEKEISEAKAGDGTQAFDGPTIRAILKKMSISIESIRTAKAEQSSTKVQCEGELKITVPVDVMSDIAKGRKMADLGTVELLAASKALKQTGNVFTKSIEYSLQPTDDGKQIFAELQAPDGISGFIAELSTTALLTPILKANEAKEAEDAQTKLAQEREAGLAAMEEQKQEEMAVAKSENKEENAALQQLWDGIPVDERKLLLDAQRAWIKKKDADCTVASIGTNSDQHEQDLRKLACETNATKQRIAELQEHLK